ncbi:MAG: DUF2950 family protein [Candidatus Methanofishera endochildressiae]|uniref:DUF2950 family protein n=1 Tax=Candidatus Methanofishera endochildressiae TaxID=2738884 RepID=A0A7Z0SE10_9GAMM|nr:DUF2950 family protein [Candidatus Methanofishera endochildressiae]
MLSVAGLHIDPSLQQVTFSKPEDAANAFASVVKKVDQTLFDKLLGEDFREILPLDDISSVDMDNFNNAWEKHHTPKPQGDKKMLFWLSGEGKECPPPPCFLVHQAGTLM